jgi:hypothetical protein
MSSEPERRPHLTVPCPLREQEGCDWVQVISWFVGGPDTTEAVSPTFRRMEAEAHLMERHFHVSPQIFT